VLRKWVDDAATRTSSRKTAKRLGLSVEGLRQFVRGDTKPQERTLRKVGEAYLAELREMWSREVPEKPALRVAERPAPFPEEELEDELRRVLPEGREQAVRWVRKLFGAIRRRPDDFPPGAERLEAPLLRFAEGLPPGDPPPRRTPRPRRKA